MAMSGRSATMYFLAWSAYIYIVRPLVVDTWLSPEIPPNLHTSSTITTTTMDLPSGRSPRVDLTHPPLRHLTQFMLMFSTISGIGVRMREDD